MKDVVLYDRHGEPMQKKENSTPDLDPTFLHSMLNGLTGNVQRISNQPYAWHSFIYAAASRRAQTMAGLKSFLKLKDDPNKVITEHPILDLLSHPNPMMSRSEFIEAVMLHLLLPTPNGPGGQCFILPTDAEGNPIDLIRGILPTFLWPFNDVLVQPKTNGELFIGWEFRHPSGRTTLFLPEQIIRIRLFNPYDLLKGQSPMAALRITIGNDAKAMEISDKFYDNNATLGTVLSTDQRLDQVTRDRMKREFHEQYEGWMRAGKTALLHSGMKITQESHNLQDLQFTEQRTFSREDVMAVYKVGKTMMGLTDTVNRATAEIEMEIFWDLAMNPDMDKYWDGMNEQFIRFQDRRNMEGAFDVSKVDALKKNQAGKIKNASQLIKDGMPANTAWRTVGLDTQTSDMEWLDEPWVKGPLVNLNTGEILGSPAAAALGAPEEVKRITSNGKTYLIKDERSAIWTSYIEKVLDPPERKYKKDYIKFLNAQRNRFLDQVDEWEKENKHLGRPLTKAEGVISVSDFMISKGPEDKALIDMADPIQQQVINRQAAVLAGTLGELTQFDTEGALAESIKASRYRFLKKLNSDTFKTMGKEIETILIENPGAQVSELAKLIKTAEREVTKGRISSTAQTVARTEVSSVASTTRFDIMKVEGVEKHEWLTAIDEFTRGNDPSDEADHIILDGEVVKIGEQFSNGLTHPLQNGAPAAETVNCRCTTIPVR